jgi:hypothetical protein
LSLSARLCLVACTACACARACAVADWGLVQCSETPKYIISSSRKSCSCIGGGYLAGNEGVCRPDMGIEGTCPCGTGPVAGEVSGMLDHGREEKGGQRGYPGLCAGMGDCISGTRGGKEEGREGK